MISFLYNLSARVIFLLLLDCPNSSKLKLLSDHFCGKIKTPPTLNNRVLKRKSVGGAQGVSPRFFAVQVSCISGKDMNELLFQSQEH